MAVGKNKKLGKARKGGKRKATDLFAKKEWYEVRTPAVFPVKSVGRTIATKTAGTKVSRDTLMGRLFEVSLGDLKPDKEDEAFRKFTLKVEDVQGFNCLTQFHGMDLTTDKLRSLVRKKQTLIEAYCDIRTTDGFALRLFAIGFTKFRTENQHRKTAYATSAQVRQIRKRMIEVIQKETTGIDLPALVEKLMIDTIGQEIEKHTQAIYPLTNTLIRKVKMLRAPKTDVSKLIEGSGGLEALTTSAQPAPGKKAEAPAPVAMAVDLGTAVEAPKEVAAPAAKKDDKPAKPAAAAPAEKAKKGKKPE
jgi:small subunit ribosomal protein S3Ae